MTTYKESNESSPRRIVVVDYDPAWRLKYETLREKISPIVQDCSLYTEHVGSTSVPGLAAKPIIDFDIVCSPNEVKLAIERLQTAGYVHRGNLGIEGREAFQNPNNDLTYHLYLCAENSPGLRNPVEFRNYLRIHPVEARRYGKLKKILAEKFPYDIDGYVHGKTDFVLEILLKTGAFTSEELAKIRSENE